MPLAEARPVEKCPNFFFELFVNCLKSRLLDIINPCRKCVKFLMKKFYFQFFFVTLQSQN